MLTIKCDECGKDIAMGEELEEILDNYCYVVIFREVTFHFCSAKCLVKHYSKVESQENEKQFFVKG